jgi:hypothetical protein
MFTNIEEAMKIVPSAKGNFIFIGELFFAKNLFEALYISVFEKKNIFERKQFHSFTTTSFFAEYRNIIEKEKNFIDDLLKQKFSKSMELKREIFELIENLSKNFSKKCYYDLIEEYFKEFPNEEIKKIQNNKKIRSFYKELIFLLDFYRHEELCQFNEKNNEAFDFLRYRDIEYFTLKQPGLLEKIEAKRKELIQ